MASSAPLLDSKDDSQQPGPRIRRRSIFREAVEAEGHIADVVAKKERRSMLQKFRCHHDDVKDAEVLAFIENILKSYLNRMQSQDSWRSLKHLWELEKELSSMQGLGEDIARLLFCEINELLPQPTQEEILAFIEEIGKLTQTDVELDGKAVTVEGLVHGMRLRKTEGANIIKLLEEDEKLREVDEAVGAMIDSVLKPLSHKYPIFGWIWVLFRDRGHCGAEILLSYAGSWRLLERKLSSPKLFPVAVIGLWLDGLTKAGRLQYTDVPSTFFIRFACTEVNEFFEQLVTVTLPTFMFNLVRLRGLMVLHSTQIQELKQRVVAGAATGVLTLGQLMGRQAIGTVAQGMNNTA